MDKFVGKTAEAWYFYNVINRSIELDRLTFADFIGYLENPRIRAADIHWRPQVDFLVYNQYDDYFALEQFANSKMTIEARSGLTILDSRPVVRHGLDQWNLLPVDSDFSRDAARRNRRASPEGESPHPRSLFTETLIGRVGELYAADLALFTDKTGLETRPGPAGFASTSST